MLQCNRLLGGWETVTALCSCVEVWWAVMTVDEMVVRAGRPVLAVTGAGGFVGQRVVAQAVAAGLPVIALLRTGHEAAALRKTGADVRVGSLDDAATLVANLRGASVLIHLAYDMRASGGRNLETFRSVMAAAGKAGVARIVHASSAVVYDAWPDGRIDEDALIGEAVEGTYRAAKIEMERWLMGSGFQAAILQPTIVYGPGSALWTDGPVAALRRGDVVLPDPVGNCPAVHVDDLAEAAVRAAVVPGLIRRRFLISGDEALTWQQFWAGYADIAGKGQVRLAPREMLAARLRPVAPRAVAKGPSTAAKVSALARRLLGRRRFEAVLRRVSDLRKASAVTYPDSSMLTLYSGMPDVAIARARDELGFVPRMRFGEALAQIRAQSR